MPRLGEILLAINALKEHELEHALENQVLHGVKLGTCLVEMGYVADDIIARCLGKQAGRTFLIKEQLIAAGADNLSLISRATMKKHRIIPVGIDDSALHIATDTFLSGKKQAELEAFFGRKVEPVAVSGYAVDCFLEQFFGIPRPGRFLSTFSRKSHAEPPSANDMAMERSFESVWNRHGESTPDGMVMLLDAARQFSCAGSRDDVAKTVLEYVANVAGVSALLIVKEDTAHGWKACSDHQQILDFEEFSGSLEELPDLRQCIVRKKPYSGQCPTPGTKLLWQTLRCPGGEAAYFPVVIRQRVVAALVCTECEGMNHDEVAELCRKASYALEILILRSKLLD